MKQYTTPGQTAKLIALGFDKPKSIGGYEPTFIVGYEGAEVSNVIIGEDKQCPIYAYSIGELLSFLPDDGVADKRLEFDGFHWFVDWDSFDGIRQTMGAELVDALYDMCINLKEEGAI